MGLSMRNGSRNATESFKTSSVLKKQPQGRCFLVEVATNHQLKNRAGLAVAVVNVTDQNMPCYPQKYAAIG